MFLPHPMLEIHIVTQLHALQRASAADIRLLSSAFKIGAKVEGHAADRAVFYLLMTAPDHAMQGVRVLCCSEQKLLRASWTAMCSNA